MSIGQKKQSVMYPLYRWARLVFGQGGGLLDMYVSYFGVQKAEYNIYFYS
jgi:hypothetical protein